MKDEIEIKRINENTLYEMMVQINNETEFIFFFEHCFEHLNQTEAVEKIFLIMLTKVYHI